MIDHTCVTTRFFLGCLMKIALVTLVSQSCAHYRIGHKSSFDKATAGPRICGVATLAPANNLPREVIEALDRAVEYWNDLLGLTFAVSTKGDKAGHIVVKFKKMSSLGTWRYRKIDPVTKCVLRGRIALREGVQDRYSTYIIETIFRHELGHALGLDHKYTVIPYLMNRALPPDEVFHPLDAHWKTIEEAVMLHGE